MTNQLGLRMMLRDPTKTPIFEVDMIELDYTSAYYEPPDADDPANDWAHCGPRAFAALLSTPISYTKHHFGGIENRSYVNPTQMKAALTSAGRRYTSWVKPAGVYSPAKLTLVLFEGPWCAPGVPIGASYRHTHWVAVRRPTRESAVWIYDCNVGFWIIEHDWRRHIAPQLVSLTPKATGWSIFKAIGVELEMLKKEEPVQA